MTSILITGGGGKLGRELVKLFPDSLHPSHGELDIADRDAVMASINRYRPEIVIHTAALTGIPPCENNKPLAWASNVEGTRNLADACARYVPASYFVHISTACVFQGDRGNYNEQDLPYPKNFYALTKLLGEYVLKGMPNCLIARTNFVAHEKWPYPKAFSDRYGTYLFADDLAGAVKDVIDNQLKGLVHVVGDRRLSMFDLAKLTTPEVQPMTMADYKGPPLTVDMTLDTVRWKKYRIGTASPRQ